MKVKMIRLNWIYGPHGPAFTVIDQYPFWKQSHFWLPTGWVGDGWVTPDLSIVIVWRFCRQDFIFYKEAEKVCIIFIALWHKFGPLGENKVTFFS